MAAIIDQINVRMYRQGFGDCFLLRFLSAGEIKHTMLIDCGLKRNDSSLTAPMTDVVNHLKTELTSNGQVKAKLDTLVITHEHWDHVSEFHPDKKFFDDIDIQQIWMAWTENPDDEIAKQINAHLRKGAKAVAFASTEVSNIRDRNNNLHQFEYTAGELSKARDEFSMALEHVADFAGPFAVTTTPSGIQIKDFTISIGTEKAMDHIKSIQGPGIKYFEPGQIITDKNKMPGIRIYVLGPPKSALINKERPSSGEDKETFFGMNNASLNGFMDGLLAMSLPSAPQIDEGRPFTDCASIANDTPTAQSLYKDNYYKPVEAWRTIEDDWKEISGALALQMDNDTNNTSLALAIEMIDSGKVLLFPGDAQVGSWLSWKDLKFKIEKNNVQQEITVDDLFGRTVLYKVSHHCSHNATLKKDGLELMTSEELVALIPEKQDQYDGIPHPPLVERIKQKTRGRILFSADENFPVNDFKNNKPPGLSEQEWDDFKNNLKIEPLFIEYNVKV